LHQSAEALFDIEKDPMESTNLIDEPSLSEVAQQMRQKVRTFRKETQDPWCLASYHADEPGMEPVVYLHGSFDPYMPG
jgi:hypothetical protein